MAVRFGTVMVGTRPEQSTVPADLDAGGFTTDDPRRDNGSIVDALPVADGYRIWATTTVDRVAAGVAAGRALIGRHVR